jgi:hypothetical protein
MLNVQGAQGMDGMQVLVLSGLAGSQVLRSSYRSIDAQACIRTGDTWPTARQVVDAVHPHPPPMHEERWIMEMDGW